MEKLDDLNLMRAGDPGRMLDRIRDLPRQLRAGWELGLAVELPESSRAVRDVVVLGMGGSAIGGDLARALSEPDARLPIVVVRDYNVPGFVGPDSLAIACSFSGQTEETISAYRQALERQAKTVVVTTGGELARLAEQAGQPLARFHCDAQPRAALGYLFLPVLAILHRLGLTADRRDEVPRALSFLDTFAGELDPERPFERNRAKQLAAKLWGSVPIVYGAGPLADVARRWKTQLNENAKTAAFFEALPELNHNAVVGYQHPPRQRDLLFFAILTSPSIHPRTRRRAQVTADLLAQAGLAFEWIEAPGDTPLAQVLAAVLLGDFASYYLAILNGVDPTPVRVIDFLKAKLAEE